LLAIIGDNFPSELNFYNFLMYQSSRCYSKVYMS
jgi:hypothetical protein